MRMYKIYQTFHQHYTIQIEFKKLIDWKEFNSDQQLELLNHTVHHPICRRFPPRKQHQTTFLKKVILELEENKVEVCDELYEVYTSLLSLPPENCEVSFKNYFIEEEQVVTLKESVNYISQGTTGLCTWQAAMQLAEWALKNRNIFKRKHVLELGSGVGLTGLVVKNFCNPGCYTFSDCHHEVLNILKENIIINDVLRNVESNSLAISSPLDLSESKTTTQNDDRTSLCINCVSAIHNETKSDGQSAELKQSGKLPNTHYTEDVDSVVNGVTNFEHCNKDGQLKPGDKSSHTKRLNSSEKSAHLSLPSVPSSTVNSRTNLKINTLDEISSLYKTIKSGHKVSNVKVLKLDWEDVNVDRLTELGKTVDMILAADVVYDKDIIPSLVNVLFHLLSSTKNSMAYVASTVRNADTTNAFLHSLTSSNLRYRKMKTPTLNVFLYSRSETILLLEIWFDGTNAHIENDNVDLLNIDT